MIKTFCSLCGHEVVGNLPDYHGLPRIEETRKSISGDTVQVYMWIDLKVNIGCLCVTCRDMYIEKLLLCLATTRKQNS